MGSSVLSAVISWEDVVVGEGLLLEVQASGNSCVIFFFFLSRIPWRVWLHNQTEEQKDNSQKHTKNETK